MLEMKRAQRAAGTAEMYRSKLGHLYRLLGATTTMASITPGSVDQYVATRKAEGAVNVTIGKELTTLSQVCKLAKRAGEYPHDVRSLRPDGFSVNYQPRKRVASRAELDLLRKHLDAREWGMVAFIVATSARLSEALRFEPDIDYDARRAVVAIRGTKTERAAREVPVLDPFAGLFREAMAGAPFDWARISHELPDRCEALNIPPLTPNDLRRTTATMLRAAGCTAEAIAMVLGHVNSRMVEQVYGRLTAEELRAVLDTQLAAGPGLVLSKTRRKRKPKRKAKR
jgi:integrase